MRPAGADAAARPPSACTMARRSAAARWKRAHATVRARQDLMPRLAACRMPRGACPNICQDCGQRWILFLDTLCRRGDACVAREKEGFKPVLAFDYDVDRRRPQARPPGQLCAGADPSAAKATPPAARRCAALGHHRSARRPRQRHRRFQERIRSRRRAASGGHPVYFVIFFPTRSRARRWPMCARPKPTFLREVQARHPHSPKPLVTGNCQGGWAAMILAATHPDLMGPVVIAGAPLSYWAGEKRPQSVPLFRRRRRRRGARACSPPISAAASSTAPIW